MLKRVRQILWTLTAFAGMGLAYLMFIGIDDGDHVMTMNNASFKADFELTDHNGEIRTADEFKGKWLLVFFGFANCPDVCPTTLAEITAVMQSFGDRASDLQPLFISIDPERDTPAALAEFIPRFDARIVGLTGSPEQIARTKSNFHIFYEKIADENAPDGYSMGHSSQLFLFGPDSEYIRSWDYGTPAEEIIVELAKVVRS